MSNRNTNAENRASQLSRLMAEMKALLELKKEEETKQADPEKSVLDILEDICDLLEQLTEDVEDIAHLMRYKQDWDESFIASIYLD